MEINYTVLLPRDAMSVPVVRRVLRTSLTTLGVEPDCISDIELALTEACTNVLDHAKEGDEYEVVARVVDDSCAIDVVDRGVGFNADGVGRSAVDGEAESGRGIQLIRALVDSVHFALRDEAGTVVHFEKSLQLLDDAPLRKLASRRPEAVRREMERAEPALEDREEVLGLTVVADS